MTQQREIIIEVESLLHEGQTPAVIKRAIEKKYIKDIDPKAWEGIMIQAQTRRAFTRPVPHQTEDGYSFYLLEDGRVSDSPHPEHEDMSWPTLQDFLNSQASK